MGRSYSFHQFGSLAMADQFEFSVAIPMPAQASSASWPITPSFLSRPETLTPAHLAYRPTQPFCPAEAQLPFSFLQPKANPPRPSRAPPPLAHLPRAAAPPLPWQK
jgi:hypothetical protein